MIETLFTLISTWIATDLALAACMAFAWGVSSVIFSPCHLAAIPVMAVHAAGYTSLPEQEEHDAGHRHHHVDQDTAIKVMPKVNAVVSVCFAVGYFCAITALGVVCALLGRVLDLEDAGEHLWFVPAGAVLLWFGVSLWREHDCSRSGRLLRGLAGWLKGRARFGSVLLGAGYGVLSSGCTLAFLAPVLIISLPQGAWTACIMAAAFALGHCLPMALVGVMTKLAQRLLRVCQFSSVAQGAHGHHVVERRFRRLASVIICAAAVVLMLHPFFEH